MQWILACARKIRIIAIEKPLAGLHRSLLILHGSRHVDAVRDAMAVGDNERRTVVGFGLEEGFERMLVLCAHRDAGHVDVAVSHRHQAKVLLRRGLAARGELRDRTARGRFRHLAAGVGVDLRIEHAAPSHCARSPGRGRARRSRCRRPSHRRRRSRRSCARACRRWRAACSHHPCRAPQAAASARATRSRWSKMSASSVWSALQNGIRARSSPTCGASLLQQLRGELSLLVERDAEAEAELGVVLEQRVAQAGPRPFAFCAQGVVGRLPP